MVVIPDQTVAPRRVSNWVAWAEVGFTLWLYYVLLVAAIALPPFLLPVFGFKLNLRQGTTVTLGATLLAELVVALVLSLWIRRQSIRSSDIGFIRPSRLATMVPALLFAVLYATWTLTIPEVRSNALELSSFKLWGAAVSVFAAVVEEAVFRGFLMNELARAGNSPTVQVMVSAVGFALVHLGFGLWGIMCTSIMGAVLAIAYLWNGRSLAAPIVAHCLINLIIEPWLLLYVITYYANMFNGN